LRRPSRERGGPDAGEPVPREIPAGERGRRDWLRGAGTVQVGTKELDRQQCAARESPEENLPGRPLGKNSRHSALLRLHAGRVREGFRPRDFFHDRVRPPAGVSKCFLHFETGGVPAADPAYEADQE
ncbi:unnamed protein product, partial [Amoebophrya sp. A120]